MGLGLALVFGVILLIAHFLSDSKTATRFRHRTAYISFTAGIFVTYVFLDLLPGIYQEDMIISKVGLLFALTGFTIFHVMEKYVYQHERRREHLRRELKEVHAIAFFLYHFVIGIVLLTIAEGSSLFRALLFFIPLLAQSLLSNTGIRELHTHVRGSAFVKSVLSGATLLGVAVGIWMPITALYQHILLGFVIGALLYVIVLDAVPKERKGRPVFFMFGVILYMILIVMSWVV